MFITIIIIIIIIIITTITIVVVVIIIIIIIITRGAGGLPRASADSQLLAVRRARGGALGSRYELGYSHEDFTRLAETRLAQNTLNYLKQT